MADATRASRALGPLDASPEPSDPTVQAVGQLLRFGTLGVVALVGAGTLLALAAGSRPIVEHGPLFEPARVVGDLFALRPAGLLWAGLVMTVALPAARVSLAFLGFARQRDRAAASVALAVLAVLGVSLAVALASSGG